MSNELVFPLLGTEAVTSPAGAFRKLQFNFSNIIRPSEREFPISGENLGTYFAPFDPLVHKFQWALIDRESFK